MSVNVHHSGASVIAWTVHMITLGHVKWCHFRELILCLLRIYGLATCSSLTSCGLRRLKSISILRLHTLRGLLYFSMTHWIKRLWNVVRLMVSSSSNLLHFFHSHWYVIIACSYGSSRQKTRAWSLGRVAKLLSCHGISRTQSTARLIHQVIAVQIEIGRKGRLHRRLLYCWKCRPLIHSLGKLRLWCNIAISSSWCLVSLWRLSWWSLLSGSSSCFVRLDGWDLLFSWCGIYQWDVHNIMIIIALMAIDFWTSLYVTK